MPEGRRDMLLFLVGCLIAESIPMQERSPGAVADAILEVGRLIVGRAWLDGCWTAERLHSSLVARADDAARGATELWRGRKKGTEYRVGRERMLRECDVRRDEVAAYCLKSVAADRDRLAAKRLAEGAVPRDIVQAANLEKARRAVRLVADGASQRSAAAQVGLHEKQLRRILASGKLRGPAACSGSVHKAVRTDRRPVEEGRKREEGKIQDSVAEPPPRAPAAPLPAAPVPADPLSALRDLYARTAASVRERGADGRIEVPAPPPDASEETVHAHIDVLEAVADARRRAADRHRRRHGYAAAAAAWHDALANLPRAEAVPLVAARRRSLWRAQADELAAAEAIGREDAARALKMRHVGQWAVENRNAERVFGPGWRRPERVGQHHGALRFAATSAAWRAAVRDAGGPVAAEPKVRFNSQTAMVCWRKIDA